MFTLSSDKIKGEKIVFAFAQYKWTLTVEGRMEDLPEPMAPGVLDPPRLLSPLEMGVNMLLVPGVYRLLVGVYAATQEP